MNDPLVIISGGKTTMPGGYSTKDPPSICLQDPSPPASVEQKRTRPRENNTVAVVIPAGQPPKPRTHRSAKRRYRAHPRTSTYRTASWDESDVSDDSDDEDYLDLTQDDPDRPTKRRKQLPVTKSVQLKPEIRSKLARLSLPDLSTVSRGLFSWDIYPSEILYSFSWTEERENSDHSQREADHKLDQDHDQNEMNSTREWKSHKSLEDETTGKPRSKQRDHHLNTRAAGSGRNHKHRKKWTEEENARLKRLREEENLSWSQIKKHFPDRTEGALQVQYSTALKDSASKSSATALRDNTGRDAGFSPSPETDFQRRRQHSLDTATERMIRSRPARARRAVEPYSP
ncbi:hypothetical protein TSTA_017320 [Talaromyces stipitatus ATCC 10500]|uniref:Myb-like domain-containing protein n=1 Tax=Talaromyces stipitatus (strain ATCC 10500 / CBS 375.48 / QM 6759 / NRRL 1006) TaxID=441959 RepID=B8MFC3_TALSN|nr:uncharacterized protein TSTA_017320 [Talaromyces stipitatus ATCC 10500]EED16657.1 hypothetical protein TSTA_017320 [Talaromyces stipitatus ATCC 10500]